MKKITDIRANSHNISHARCTLNDKTFIPYLQILHQSSFPIQFHYMTSDLI